MPPSLPSSADVVRHEEAFGVLVTDQWVDEFCEHVGSLCAVLQALSRVEGTDRPPALIVEALNDCATLQDLLNAIPIWGGPVASGSAALPYIAAGHVVTPPKTMPSQVVDLSDVIASDMGDSFPEFRVEQDDTLPAVDKSRLEERCLYDAEVMLNLLQQFRLRAEGDVRELELLSVGHDWTRLSRLAGVLKNAAGQVSADRIVVDAAALQGAARIGCRNDVDLALDALRADLRACASLVAEWQS